MSLLSSLHNFPSILFLELPLLIRCNLPQGILFQCNSLCSISCQNKQTKSSFRLNKRQILKPFLN